MSIPVTEDFDLHSRLRGERLGRSHLIPEGHLYRMYGHWYAAPLTYWSLTHEGRFPFESRYSRGRIELERDRRRRAKR